MFDQLLVGAAPGDAITKSALLIRDALRAEGPAEIYAQHVEPGLGTDVGRLDQLTMRPNRARPLVFHASMGSWPVYRALRDEPQRHAIFTALLGNPLENLADRLPLPDVL